MDKLKIDINFFPLQRQDFEFTVYIQKCLSDKKRSSDFNFETKHLKLTINDETNYDYDYYFVTLTQQADFEQQIIKSNNNNWLTLWYLYHKLLLNTKRQGIEFSCFGKYEKYIDISINKTNMGTETISIIPKYLCGQFGLLIDFRFRKDVNAPFTREIQKLSLSLDSSGKPNKNYYSDKYNKITSFVNTYKYSLLNIFEENIEKESSMSMLKLDSDRLNVKKYMFGKENSGTSQFKGVETYGPYQPYNGNPILCFVYRNNEKDLSHTLYRALQGKTYSTFSGMEKMFAFPMNKENVIGISVNDYSESEIINLINDIKIKSSGRPVIPIVIVPWTREVATKEQSKQYYMMKHHFIKENIPSQFIGIPRVGNYENLKWSVSSIGLQIFTKLGGSPWCMEVTRNNCLIIGIGQSHRRDIHKRIEKYYSYSIMTDSSGIFKNIKVLSENTNKNEYLNGLVNKLRKIILAEINNYDSVVIHTSFRLRDEEIKKINSMVNDLSDETNKDFMVIRFSDNHDFMGFNLDVNSKTPLESTMLQINKNEYLVWFEGLSSVTHTIKTRIGPPMHLTIDFAKSYSFDEVRNNLQDAINLSGANWRGFNAKTTPVSVLYARLLSSFLAAFEENNLEEINIEQLTPWFL
jgi:hypothetical protein